MAYIDRDKFYNDMLKRFGGVPMLTDHNSSLRHDIHLDEALDMQPTADVVEVCRCHECKYGDNGIQKQEVYTVCNRFGNGILKMSPLDYCSYGERRTDNDV